MLTLELLTYHAQTPGDADRDRKAVGEAMSKITFKSDRLGWSPGSFHGVDFHLLSPQSGKVTLQLTCILVGVSIFALWTL